ncbi:hypothetical protein SGRIM128S_05035 [Streptomyces griseomycini]
MLWNEEAQQWEGDNRVEYGYLAPGDLVEKFTPEQWDALQRPSSPTPTTLQAPRRFRWRRSATHRRLR